MVGGKESLLEVVRGVVSSTWEPALARKDGRRLVSSGLIKQYLAASNASRWAALPLDVLPLIYKNHKI